MNETLAHADQLWRTRQLDQALQLATSLIDDPIHGPSAQMLRGNCLRDLGRTEEALQALGAAIDGFRVQIAQQPSLQDDLARALLSRGATLDEVGHYSAAEDDLLQAVAILEGLQRTAPGAHTANLAAALNNLGEHYSDCNDPSQACAYQQRAVQLLLGLRERSVDDEALLGLALNNYGNALCEARRYADADRVLEQALANRRALAQAHPHYRPELAMTLYNYGNYLEEVRRFPEAGRVLQEALDLYDALQGQIELDIEPDRARALNNLGVLCWRIGRNAEAISHFNKARTIHAELAKSAPDKYLHMVAEVDGNLGLVYEDANEPEKADAAHRACIQAFSDLAERGSPQAGVAVPIAINNYGAFKLSVQHYEDAVTLLRQTCASLQQRADQEGPDDAEETLADLAMASCSLGQALDGLHADAEAAATHDAAVATVEQLRQEGSSLARGHVSASYRSVLRRSLHRGDALRYAQALLAPDAPNTSDPSALQQLLAEADEQHQTKHTVVIVCQGTAPNAPAFGVLTRGGLAWMTGDLGDLNPLQTALERAADRDLAPPTDPPTTAEHMRQARHDASRAIWQQLPAPLRDVLHEAIEGGNTPVLCAEPTWSQFPWELLKTGEADDAFLGLRLALPRLSALSSERLQATLDASPLGAGTTNGVVLAPHLTGSLPLHGAAEEAQAVAAAAKARGFQLSAFGVGHAALDSLVYQGLQQDPAFFFFAGHGQVIDEEELLLFAKQPSHASDPPHTHWGVFHLEQLSRAQPAWSGFKHRPLVVLNACVAGRVRSFGGAREDLIQAFLKHGAGAVIACPVPLPDKTGALFGSALATQPKATRIGDRVVAARRAAAKAEAGLSHATDRWAWIHLHDALYASGPF